MIAVMEIRENNIIGENIEIYCNASEYFSAGGFGALLAPQRGPGAEPRKSCDFSAYLQPFWSHLSLYLNENIVGISYKNG